MTEQSESFDEVDEVDGVDGSPREHDPAVEHGDSPDPVDDVDHDVTNPSNDLAENEVNRLLGGNFPLR